MSKFLERIAAIKKALPSLLLAAAGAISGGWIMAKLTLHSSSDSKTIGAPDFQRPQAAPSASAAPSTAGRPLPSELVGAGPDLFSWKSGYRGLADSSLASEGASGVSLQTMPWEATGPDSRPADLSEEMALWDLSPASDARRLSRPAAALRRAFVGPQVISNEDAGFSAGRANVISEEADSCESSGCSPEGEAELDAEAFDGVSPSAAGARSAPPVPLASNSGI